MTFLLFSYQEYLKIPGYPQDLRSSNIMYRMLALSDYLLLLVAGPLHHDKVASNRRGWLMWGPV